jgi:hypothetical protein
MLVLLLSVCIIRGAIGRRSINCKKSQGIIVCVFRKRRGELFWRRKPEVFNKTKYPLHLSNIFYFNARYNSFLVLMNARI